jgi:hypothetical protein
MTKGVRVTPRVQDQTRIWLVQRKGIGLLRREEALSLDVALVAFSAS